MAYRYTEEQKQFIRDHVEGRTSNELTDMFNRHFDTDLKVSQIRSFKKNNGLKGGVNTRFKKGQAPFNKGKKGVGGWKPTQFKKGHKPHNYKPIGTERINSDGYIDIKIADPNKWKAKHLLIWEEANGPVPEGYAVIFGDGNPRNFDLDNLVLVSRQQLLVMNRKGLIQKDADLTRTGVIVADIYRKIYERRTAK